MQTDENRPLWVLASLAVPYPVMSLSLVVESALQWAGPFDWFWLTFSTLVSGTICWRATRGYHWAVRSAITISYLLIVAYLLFYYVFIFACFMYGDCL